MASNREVRSVRVIVTQGGTGKTSSAKPQNGKVEAKQESDNSWYTAILTMSVKEVGRDVVQLAEYGINKYGTLEEDYKGQVAVQNAKTAISRVASVASSTIVGFKVAGTAGAVTGAVLGTLSVGLSVAKDYADAYQQLDEVAYSKYYYGKRYGLVDGSKGTEN